MNRICRFAVITIFLAGLVTVGILGTSASMTFVWPGYLVIGLAGIASVIAIFKRTKYVIPFWCMIAAFAFSGYLLLRAMGSPVAYFAREDGSLLITCFIAYAVFLSMLDDSRWRRGLFWCITGLIGLNCGMAVIQLIFGAETWILSGYERTFPNRIGGLFNHPDHFAGFLALGIPFLVSSMVFGKHSKAGQITLGTLSVFSLVGIILSKSLLGLAAAVFGISILGVILLLLSWHKMVPNTRRAIIKSSLFLITLLSIFACLNSSRISNLVEQKILTREGQISLPGIWNSSIQQFSEAPLAGTGSRTFYFFSRKYRPEEEGAARFESEFVHNEYLQLLADYGIIGLLLALGFVGLHFFYGSRFILGYVNFPSVRGAILPQSDHLGMVAGAVSAVGTIAFLSMFDFVMHVPAFAVVATVLIGVLACPDPMSCALRPEEKDAYIPGGSCLFLGRGLAFGCGLALTIFSCIFSRSEWQFEMARNAYHSGNVGLTQMTRLEIAREIDPQNPNIQNLSGHTYVRAIQPDMPKMVRHAYLIKAENFFAKAADLYPQDIDCALAHSVVLDALGRSPEAGKRIREARKWAPKNADLLIAQAEHFLRDGEYDRAEKSYLMAREDGIFIDETIIESGLAAVETRRLENPTGSPDHLAEAGRRTIKDANIRELEFSGDVDDALEASIKRLETRLNAGRKEIEPVKE